MIEVRGVQDTGPGAVRAGVQGGRETGTVGTGISKVINWNFSRFLSVIICTHILQYFVSDVL